MANATHTGLVGGTGGSDPWAVLLDGRRGVLYVAFLLSDRVSAVNLSSGAIVRAAPTGSGPDSLALGANGSDLFVGNSGGSNVTVLNASTFASVASVTVATVTGTSNSVLAFDPKEHRMFVADFSGDNLTVFDTSTFAVLGFVPTGRAPNDITYDPTDSLVFVANSGSNNVSVVNATSLKVLRSVAVGKQPLAIRWDGADHSVYVANRQSNNLSVFGPNSTTVIRSIPTGIDPQSLAVDTARRLVLVGNDTGLAFVDDGTNRSIAWLSTGSIAPGMDIQEPTGVGFASDPGNATLLRVDLTTHVLAGTIEVGLNPEALTYAPGVERMVTAASSAARDYVLNASDYTRTETLSAGAGSSGVAFDPDSGRLFTSNRNTNNVTVIQIGSAAPAVSIPVGVRPEGLVLANGTVFVVNGGSDTASLIDASTLSVVRTVGVGVSPDALAFDNRSGRVYVANQGGNVTVLDATTGRSVASLAAGRTPWGIAYCPNLDRVFVANQWGNVSVFDASTDRAVGSVGVGFDALGVACNGRGGYVYVTHWATDNVSIIDGATLRVADTVTVGASPSAAAYDPLTDTVAVTNTIDSTVAFLSSESSNGFLVRFSETGLPPASLWSVTLGGSTLGGTYPTVSFREPNGTYAYSVTPPLGYSASTSARGTVLVNGRSVDVPIDFSAIAGSRYALTFQESGLPAGSTWSVSLNGTSQSTLGTAIAFQVPNGSYAFTVAPVWGYSVTPRSSTVTILGAGQTIPIAFSPAPVARYLVSFRESGLPTGARWSVVLNGTSNSSTGSAVGFYEPNGTYSFTASGPASFHFASVPSSVLVAGRPVNLTLSASENRGYYLATFSESGLPAGTNWSVTLSGNRSAASTTAIVFVEPNGTYPFHVEMAAGGALRPTPADGTVNIAGRDTAYPVTFVATGGPGGNGSGSSGWPTVAGLPVWEFLPVIAALVVGGVVVRRVWKRRPASTSDADVAPAATVGDLPESSRPGDPGEGPEAGDDGALQRDA